MEQRAHLRAYVTCCVILETYKILRFCLKYAPESSTQSIRWASFRYISMWLVIKRLCRKSHGTRHTIGISHCIMNFWSNYDHAPDDQMIYVQTILLVNLFNRWVKIDIEIMVMETLFIQYSTVAWSKIQFIYFDFY